MKAQVALHLLWLMTLQLHHLPPPLLPPVTLLGLSPDASPCTPAVSTTELFRVLYCKMFSLFFVFVF